MDERTLEKIDQRLERIEKVLKELSQDKIRRQYVSLELKKQFDKYYVNYQEFEKVHNECHTNSFTKAGKILDFVRNIILIANTVGIIYFINTMAGK